VKTPPSKAKAKAKTHSSSSKNLASCAAKDKDEERGVVGSTAKVFSRKRKSLDASTPKDKKYSGIIFLTKDFLLFYSR
jgi:hypothetical protein